MIATKTGGCRDSGATFQGGVTDAVVPWEGGCSRLWCHEVVVVYAKSCSTLATSWAV